MIGDITSVDEIYIVCGYTDMRKFIDGLCAVEKEQLHIYPYRRALYMFCGRRCDRIKLLLWEPNGFVLLYKRPCAQGRYRWARDKSEAKSLTWREFNWLISGLEIDQPKAIRTSSPYLVTYFKDGRCSFSNNPSENAIRPFTVGRKNWLFSDTPDGAMTNAVIYTIVEMAKVHKQNVHRCRCHLLTKRPDKCWSDTRLPKLAPWDLNVVEACRKDRSES